MEALEIYLLYEEQVEILSTCKGQTIVGKLTEMALVYEMEIIL